MARGFQGALLRALGADEHLLTVVEVLDLTPHYRRIVFEAPGLFDGAEFEPAAYLRLWVPDISKPEREHQRGYTVVDPDAATGRLSLDFVMHEVAGPAAAWAAAAEIGDELPASRYGATKFQVPDPAPDGFLLMGDPAGLPAINSVIAALPADRPVQVLLEISHDEDRELPITRHPLLEVDWVRSDNGPEALAAAIRDQDWSNWYAWATAETVTVRRVRERLKSFGFPRGDVHATAYWIRGRAMGVDRGGDEKADAAASAASVPQAEQPRPTAAPKRGWRSRAGAELMEPLRGRLVLAGVLEAVVSLLRLAPFVVLAEVARRLLAGDTDDLLPLGVLAAILLGAGTTVSLLLVLAMHLLDARFGHEVRTRVVEKLGRLPLGWFTDRSSGRVKQAVQDDTASLHYLVTHAVLDVVAAVVTPLAVIGYLFWVDARLAPLLLLPLIVAAVLTVRMMTQSATAMPAATEWTGRVSSEAIAYLDGIDVARVYDTGERSRLRRTLREHADFLQNWQRPFTASKTAVDLVTRPATSVLLLSLVGVPLVIAGALPAVTLIPFFLLGVTFSGQLLAIGYGTASLREASQAANRIGVLLADDELTPTTDSATLDADPGRTVRFERVRFGYSPRHEVLSGIDLELSPGTVTALVGPSGAGKSTLAALLARFHDVTSGAITIDGVDLRRLDTEELYRSVGFVFQSVSLIRGTVRENIALGRPEATEDQIVNAARAAQIHDRIMDLPQGYETELGETARLSGGEGQRVQIARAILADHPVLVLDEATAFADPESEFQVQQALSELVAGRTVLVIAHRLHSIMGARRIVVLDDGRIVQQGSHDDLLAAPGLYRDLWSAGRSSIVDEGARA